MNYASIDKLTTRAEKNPLEVAEAKENGQKVFGFYCLYSPVEVALAAGGIAVTLCGTRNDPIPAAEKNAAPQSLPPDQIKFRIRNRRYLPVLQSG